MAHQFGFDLVPDSDLTRSLGSTSKKWYINGHFKEIIVVDFPEMDEDTDGLGTYIQRMTANHVLINDLAFSDADMTWTTARGEMEVIKNVAGTYSPAMKLYFGIPV